MPTSNPSKMTVAERTLFHGLWSQGWFVTVVGTEEDRVTVKCEMFSRDHDEETGLTDILTVDVDELTLVERVAKDGWKQLLYVKPSDVKPSDQKHAEPCCAVCNHPAEAYSIVRAGGARTPCPTGCGNNVSGYALSSAAKFNGVFELREEGPAALLDQRLPVSWGYKDMPSDMAAAIAGLILPRHFPQEAESMRKQLEAIREEQEEEGELRNTFWDAVSQEASALRAAGDQWGALKVEREGINKLNGWVDTPYDDEDEEQIIPEPNLDDMVPLRHSLLEEDEYDFLPDGGHLLPQEFQDFLRRWNMTIADSMGEWLGESRKVFKKENPELWQLFLAEKMRLSKLYPTELAALKAYQAEDSE